LGLCELVRKPARPSIDKRSIKRAIIRYLLSCIDAKPTDVRPDQVASAKRHLAEIRLNDPKFLAEIERYYSPDN
jgi:hypothetical protein